MKSDNEQSKIDLVTERLKLWGDALNMLAQPEMAAQLITVLEAGDRQGPEAVLGPTSCLTVPSYLSPSVFGRNTPHALSRTL